MSPGSCPGLRFLVCEGQACLDQLCGANGGQLRAWHRGGSTDGWPGGVCRDLPQVPGLQSPLSSPAPEQPSLICYPHYFLQLPWGAVLFLMATPSCRKLGMAASCSLMHLPQFPSLSSGRAGGPGCFTARGAGGGSAWHQPGHISPCPELPCGYHPSPPLPQSLPISPLGPSWDCCLPFLMLFLVQRHPPCSHSSFNSQSNNSNTFKYGRRAFQAVGIAHAKVLGQHHACCVGGTVRRPV